MKSGILMSLRLVGLMSVLLVMGGAGKCSGPATPAEPVGGEQGGLLSADERLVTILQTNDIHGSVEPYTEKDGSKYGGMAMIGGIVRAIREGTTERYGTRAGVLVVDAGDQFQGTLISNFNEGELMFSLMNQIGYDAVVPGNHDYDFGPVGWLEDQVTPQTGDQDPRGALLKLKKMANFPLISANTYFKDSIQDAQGRPVKVKGVNCAPVAAGSAIDWSKAQRPEFLAPYEIKKAGEVRVALIGIDNPTTPETTTPANVSDLCFRDKVETYMEIRRALEGKADVFVAVIHDGDIQGETHASDFVRALLSQSFQGSAVDAVVAGHTHQVNDLNIEGVPMIQSASGARMFGRIDLIWNAKTGRVDRQKSRGFGGVGAWYSRCEKQSQPFCETEGQAAAAVPKYDGKPALPDSGVSQEIAAARAEVERVSGRKLGVAEGKLTVDRINESPLANMLTDAFRELTGAEIAFMNTGGIRAPIPAGDVTYDGLYSVLPFNNHGVEIGPMPIEKLFKLLERSMRTCGQYGALMQSGLKVLFERDCSRSPGGGSVDEKARLLRVETLSGEVLLDVEKGIEPSPIRTFRVATLDFLSAGGSGYADFAGVPLIRGIGILREAMAERFLERGGETRFPAKIDGRWKGVKPLKP